MTESTPVRRRWLPTRAQLEAESVRLHQQWGALVMERRKSLGLSQVAVAKAARMDQGSLSNLENGEMRSVSDRYRLGLARALDCSVADLFPYPNGTTP
jgi:transcriptional regulator with XRE-family HTH domain